MYNREEVLEAIRRWTEQYGSAPTSDDWDPGRASRNGHTHRAERFRAGGWPSARMVRRQFKTFGAAVEAAGVADRPPRNVKPRLEGRHEVLRAIREWTRRYGEPPSQADWDVARARVRKQEWRIARYRDGDWPSLVTVRFHYGSLVEAIRAAGLDAPTRWEPLDERLQRQLRNATALAYDVVERGPAGPAGLAEAVRAVAAAKLAGDEDELRRELIALAERALSWAAATRFTPEAGAPE